MPIEYRVSDGGHFIHAIAQGEVTNEEFIDYEEKHGSDARVKAPCKELLEIPTGAFRLVTHDAVEEVLSRRRSRGPRVCHHCAIVVSYSDAGGLGPRQALREAGDRPLAVQRGRLRRRRDREDLAGRARALTTTEGRERCSRSSSDWRAA
jgi:hypothetical protein